jgi:hypothetical protein
MTKYKPLPPLQVLQKLFSVNEDGRLLCKQRPHPHSRCKPGDEVGTLHPLGYRKVTINGSPYFVHRVIWFLVHGEDPGQMQVDHINRVRDDNRIENLRLVTGQQNKWNRDCFSGSQSGHRGIRRRFWGKSYKWEATFQGRYIGSYQTLDEAIEAWDREVRVVTGEFFCPQQN